MVKSSRHAIQVIEMPVGDSVSQFCVLIWLMGRALVARHMFSEVFKSAPISPNLTLDGRGSLSRRVHATILLWLVSEFRRDTSSVCEIWLEFKYRIGYSVI